MELPSTSSNESLEALLKNMSINAGEIQAQVLEEILGKNANTEYLTRFLGPGFFNPSMVEVDHKQLFKQKVPVVEYQDILSYVERIANGEPHRIVSADPIVELICSSGTSGGKQKWFPRTAQELSHSAFFHKLGQNILNKHIGYQALHGGKRMFLRFLAPEITTPGGLVVRSAISSLLRHNLSNLSSNPAATSPDEVSLCEDVAQSMYSHLLCGLVQRETVVIIGTVFASGLFRVMKFLEEHWQELCSDIREWRISDRIKDPKCRQAVSSILCEPMPNLADLIEKECGKKSWEGIIKNLWPRTKCLEVVVTGSMAQYIPKLEFYSGGLPLVSLFYAASEGCFGINLKPFSDPYNVSYCLIPWMAYYEFLPTDLDLASQDDKDDGGGGVDLANVKIGQHYELVVTNFSGLYRYRMGDIVRVTGIDEKNGPEFRFVRRKNVILSIVSDKTTEGDLSKAVSKAIKDILEPGLAGFLLSDYTSCVDLSSSPAPHYVLFWELHQMMYKNGEEEEEEVASVMEKCCNVVDESLDMTYREWRERNVIGPLEIRVVKQGAFDALMDFSLSLSLSHRQWGITSFSQYKTPRSLQSPNAIHLLNSMVVASFFST